MSNNEDQNSHEHFLALSIEDQLNYWDAEIIEMDDETKKKYQYFVGLKFEDKLKFWDENKIPFHYFSHDIAHGHLISIEPLNSHELILYNKWVINHYRMAMQNKIHGHDQSGFVIVYKSYDALIDNFNAIDNNSKTDFIQGQYEYIKRVIDYSKVNEKILKRVYNAFKNKSEEDVYTYKHDIVSVLLKLRDIAKIFDVVKYKVYLETQNQKLGTNKIYTSKYQVPELSELKIQELYNELVINEFIDKSTDKTLFTDVFSNKVIYGMNRIKWIDKSLNNRQVNKSTLIAFIEYIADANSQDINTFIKEHFEVFQLTKDGSSNAREIIKITSDNLAQTRKGINGSKSNKRVDLIIKIAKTVFKHQ